MLLSSSISSPQHGATFSRGPAYQPRPLMSLCAVMWQLDYDDDQVRSLVDSGALPWAFDIGLGSAKRTQLRILADCVQTFLLFGACQEQPWEEVAARILPDPPASIPPKIAARALGCGSDHIMNLLRARAFRLVRPGWRQGPGGAAAIDSRNFLEWLHGRRVQ